MHGQQIIKHCVDSSRNVMAHGDAREGKWRWNWRMEWVDSTLHTTSEHGVSSITTADAHTSAASSRLNWRPRRFKWTCPFRRKTKSGFCACAITFQTQCTFFLGGRGDSYFKLVLAIAKSKPFWDFLSEYKSGFIFTFAFTFSTGLFFWHTAWQTDEQIRGKVVSLRETWRYMGH